MNCEYCDTEPVDKVCLECGKIFAGCECDDYCGECLLYLADLDYDEDANTEREWHIENLGDVR